MSIFPSLKYPKKPDLMITPLPRTRVPDLMITSLPETRVPHLMITPLPGTRVPDPPVYRFYVLLQIGPITPQYIILDSVHKKYFHQVYLYS